MTSATIPSLRELYRSLRHLGNARNAQLAFLAALWTALALCSSILLATGLDAMLRFSSPVRWLAASCLCLLLLAGLYVTVRNAFRSWTLTALAALAEKSRPQANNAIINAVQLSLDDTPHDSVVQAILQENTVNPEDIAARETYSPRAYRPLLAAIPLVAIIAALMFSLSGERCSIALRRILQPYADIQPFTETYLTAVTPESAIIRRGDPLTVTAVLKGIIPEQSTIQWQTTEDSPLEEQTMTAYHKDHARLSYDFEAIFDSFRFRIVSNDATSPWHSVTVDNPPGLETWECNVIPPAYTGLKPYSFTAADEKRDIIGGSQIIFAAAVSRTIAEAKLFADDKQLAFITHPDTFDQFKCQTQVPFAGTIHTQLKTEQGFAADIKIPVNLISDRIPTIALLKTPTVMKLAPEETFTVTFAAADDYAIKHVAIEQILPDNRTDTVATAVPSLQQQKVFHGRFVVDTRSFDRSHLPLRFRLRAVETASVHPDRNGLSPVISVSFLTAKQAEQKQKDQKKESEATLDKLLVLQKNELKNTNEIMLRNSRGTTLKPIQLTAMYQRQKHIRDLAVELLANRSLLGVFGDTLAGMVNKEFPEALTAIDALNQAPANKAIAALQKVAVIQTRIVALLSTMDAKAMNSEEKHRERADVFALIQRLVKDQNVLIRLTTDATKKTQLSDDKLERLIDCQVDIAKGILAFNDLALKTAEDHAEDDFSAHLRKAVQAAQDGKSYAFTMEAADLLDAEEIKPALDAQKKALPGLAKAYTILNQWRLNHAKKSVLDAKQTIAEVKEALKGIEQTQAHIAEVARELQKRGLPEDDPTLKDDMEKMAREHEKMLDLLEKLANDLYQFPDLPVCNELNSKMREIFEDVLQAKDSENLKAVEIAVQKEDSLLDLIRNTTERIDDVEMWLPDVPDHFVWNMESFDADEFPEMPLVELPEELQDIVGELLEQDMDIDAMSQDTTGNNMIADMEMGWAIMDGPMPCFSAKGKSGNTRPNDNEMTGRSGAGREGQSTGELVENHVKGYEGRKTHARKTNDKFQKGQVTEDKDSTLDARSTGGGKLGGDSESIGMFGNTVRRDLHRGDHGKSPRQLRQETDVLFAKARLLYVNPGSLGEVAHHLNGFGKNPPDLKSFDRIRKKVVRRLSDSVIEMKEGTVLPMPVDPVVKHHANAAEQRLGETISDDYKTQLNSYFKSLSK